MNKADSLEILGKYQDAIYYYEKVIESDPNNIDVFFKKGKCLKNLENIKNMSSTNTRCNLESYPTSINAEKNEISLNVYVEKLANVMKIKTNEKSTIKQVKLLIYESLEEKPKKLTLSYYRTILEDSFTLKYYAIKNNYTVLCDFNN
jgi:tetratricopeptide (TPR) repeat protein